MFSHFLVFNFIFTWFKAIRSRYFLLIEFAFVLGKNHVFELIFRYLPFYDQFSYAPEYRSMVAGILCEERSNKQAALIKNKKFLLGQEMWLVILTSDLLSSR